MAKLSERLEAKRAIERREFARRENEKLFKEALRANGYVNAPEELEKLFKENELPRLNAVVFTSYTKATEASDCKIFGIKDRNHFFLSLIQEKGKPFPTLYIYSHQLNKSKWVEEVMKTITTQLRIRYNLGVPEYVYNTLKEIPYTSDSIPNLRFDGSKKRVMKLSQQPDAVIYGECICAYHNSGIGMDEWTVYIAEIDPYLSMTKYIMSKTGMDEELAAKIAEAVGCEDYFLISKPSNNALEYAKNMARFLKVSEDDEVNCLMQGKLGVFCDEDGNLAVDIDDELPAVIIVPNNNSVQARSYLHIYLPAKTEAEENN